MVSEAVEKKLYEAASKGDVTTLQQLVQEDPYLIHGVSFPCSRNLLHIASVYGQTAIVEQVLKLNPLLARSSDSQKSSPLHIAVDQGDLEVAKRLLLVAPEMCWWRDDQGMNPVHIAAVKGRYMVLAELLRLDLSPARERVHRGQTALHLCVKHCQIQTLKALVEKLGDFVCAKDDDGETLLHLAVRSNQLEIVRYLVESNKIKKLAANSTGKTALDILDESFRDTSTYLEMRRILHNVYPLSIVEHFPKLTDMTMVVVVLIATMAFQVTVSPPGGVWQEDTSSHNAGRAVMATTHPRVYKHFVDATTTAFISAIVTILLISTGAPQVNFFFLAIATYSMWVAITSIGVSFGVSLIMTNPMETKSVGQIVAIVASVFVIVYVLLFLYFPIRKLVSSSLRRVQRLQQDLTADSDNLPKHALVSTYVRVQSWLQVLTTTPLKTLLEKGE
ncbi:ankyrin repeat-containing protein-like protein [Salvia divinorum]|uniref:Ankyrin repeat-containing protein-like protein n=1 Tax=Salvia divinorum TaxID=28513 RepID=A0ABD1GD73_SALDI